MENFIVIVEDEYLIARDLKDILTKEGYKVIINIDSVELAISTIELCNPVLVIIDINLRNGNDGISLGEYLLEKDTIPYIYLTSNSDKVTIDRVKKTRPYGFLVKPYKDVDIITTVAIVLDNFIHRKIDPKRYKVEINSDIPYLLKTIIAFINENIENKLDINEIAAKTPWGYHHFLRVFKEYVGLTPYQYILKKKIERAQSLLIETNIPVAQIAYKLGFESHGTFTNTFSKIVGVSPSKVRKLEVITKE
jgi:AraC-like DNA-binding protein/ActR/RegA family two-component response regulator